MLTFGSLFAGIGGMDIGLERAGLKCLWQCENDPDCLQILNHHWPDIPKYGDITQVDWSDVPPVDLLCGGFPCQPFSSCGNFGGKDDERYLWGEYARAIRELRPSFILIENVRGILFQEIETVLSDLARGGYDAIWDVVPAALFGAPHKRERVFILAHSHNFRQQQEHGAADSYKRLLARRMVTESATCWNSLSIDRQDANALARSLSQPLYISLDDGISSGLSRQLWKSKIRMIGNAVCPPVTQFMGEVIIHLSAGNEEKSPQPYCNN